MAEPQTQTQTDTLTCHWHPAVSTRLWCSQCRKAICTDCMVQVPVGIRCRECGRAQPLPTYDVRPPHYLRGFATAIGTIIAGVLLWFLLSDNIAGAASWLGIVMPVAIGYTAGFLISRAVNLKRGRILTFVAGATVVISVLIVLPFDAASLNLWSLMATIAGVILATDRVRV